MLHPLSWKTDYIVHVKWASGLTDFSFHAYFQRRLWYFPGCSPLQKFTVLHLGSCLAAQLHVYTQVMPYTSTFHPKWGVLKLQRTVRPWGVKATACVNSSVQQWYRVGQCYDPKRKRVLVQEVNEHAEHKLWQSGVSSGGVFVWLFPLLRQYRSPTRGRTAVQ